MVDLPGAGRPDQHVEDPSRGGDLLDGSGLVGRQHVAPAGQAGPDGDGDRGGIDGRAGEVAAGVEEAGFGVEEAAGRVDDVVSGPEAAGPVRAPEPLGGVMQLGCGHLERRAEGEVDGPFRDGDPVVGGGEADPVELAVDLGDECWPG